MFAGCTLNFLWEFILKFSSQITNTARLFFCVRHSSCFQFSIYSVHYRRVSSSASFFSFCCVYKKGLFIQWLPWNLSYPAWNPYKRGPAREDCTGMEEVGRKYGGRLSERLVLEKHTHTHTEDYTNCVLDMTVCVCWQILCCFHDANPPLVARLMKQV